MNTWPIQIESTGVYIATDISDLYMGDDDIMTSEEWREIRLISAAPALLEICKLIANMSTEIVDFDTHKILITSDEIKWIHDIIAQIEGETQ